MNVPMGMVREAGPDRGCHRAAVRRVPDKGVAKETNMTTIAGSGTPVQARRFFADLSVNVKILTAVSIAVLVAIIVGTVGLRALSTASGSAQLIYFSNVASIKAVSDVKSAMAQTRVDIANHAISTDNATRAKYEQAFTADLQAVDAGFTAYAASHPAGDPTVIADIQSTWQAYAQIAKTKQLPAGRAHDLKTWQNNRDTLVTPLMTKINQDLGTVAVAENADAGNNAATAKSDYQSSRTTSIVLLIVGSLLALILGAWVPGWPVRSYDRWAKSKMCVTAWPPVTSPVPPG
jgi:methyl-accepting chemotaxis protein